MKMKKREFKFKTYSGFEKKVAKTFSNTSESTGE